MYLQEYLHCNEHSPHIRKYVSGKPRGRRPSSLLSKHNAVVLRKIDYIYLKLNITAAPFHDIILCRISNHKIGARLLNEAEAMRVSIAA